ncbi:MAG TPA: hypothetical protein VG099_06940 [Gemmataceae bacterium]|nr:hypothetical protein [Gemmataceae bacterium]
MALIHYLYIGHFIPEGGLVRFQDHRPVATRPINLETVSRLLNKWLGETPSPEKLAKEWGMSIFPDYIVCHYSGPPLALEIAAEYAECEGAIILDLGSFSLLTPEELRQSAALNRTQ